MARRIYGLFLALMLSAYTASVTAVELFSANGVVKNYCNTQHEKSPGNGAFVLCFYKFFDNDLSGI